MLDLYYNLLKKSEAIVVSILIIILPSIIIYVILKSKKFTDMLNLLIYLQSHFKEN